MDINPRASLASLLAAKEIVVVCGPGGVGKTTTSAASAAMAAAKHGGRVLVLTVDPARRLADALGMAQPRGAGANAEASTDDSADDERMVPAEAFTTAGVWPRGELWTAMVDTKRSWDALVRRHSPDEQTAERILANPLYQNVAERFVESHEYIAVERLYEIHSGGRYDLIVVDTPPTSNAVDFLEAPRRMAEFFSSRLLRWLIVPYRSRLFSLASRPFYQVADRVLGTQFLEDVSEFFVLFQSMYSGFVERAEAVTRLLRDRRTTFMAVSTLEAAPLHETELFVDALHDHRFHLGAVVLNKVLPAYLRDEAGTVVAERILGDLDAIARRLAPSVAGGPGGGADVAQARRVLAEVAESYLNFAVVARREAEQEAELSSTPDVVVSVPQFDTDICDLESLLRLGERLWAPDPAPTMGP